MKPLQGNLDFFLIRASRGPFRSKHKTQGIYMCVCVCVCVGFPDVSVKKLSAMQKTQV